MEAVEGMILDNTGEQYKNFALSTDAFSKMKKLRLLRVSYQQSFGDNVKYLSNDLRFLDWTGYHLRSLPPSFQPDNLVALFLPYSRIEQLWKENRPLSKLKLVNLSGSQNLIKTPDFSRAPNLESLILEDCTSIVDVHLGVQSKLKLLNLRGCKSLRRLPTKIKMESLETLDLSGCSKLQKLPQIDLKMKKLIEIYLDGTSIEEIASWIEHLSGLKLLSLRDCKNLRSLGTEIIGMESLETLILSGCSKLQRFPQIVSKMKNLVGIFLDWTGNEEFASWNEHLNGVKLLSLRDCKNLRSLGTKIIGIESLEKLILSGCSNLQKFPEIDGGMKCLQELYLDGTGIEELPSSIGHLKSLVLLNLKDCNNLESLPSSIDGRKTLKKLILSSCSKVETLPENLQQVETLKELDLSRTAIRKPPLFIFELKNLEVLSFSGCKGPPSKVRSIFRSPFTVLQRGSVDSIGLMLRSFSSLSSLKTLNMSYCNLGEGVIPGDICGLSSLETLDLRGNNFISLPENLGELSKLDCLLLSNCKKLKSLPKLLTSTHSVSIDGCASLEVIEDPIMDCRSKNRGLFFAGEISGCSCYKLDEKNTASTMIKRIKIFAKENRNAHISVPGSEIPEWFSHQTDESSIKIQLPPNNGNDSQWIGVAHCFVLVSAFNVYDVWEHALSDDDSEVISISYTNGFGRGFTGKNYWRKLIRKDHLFLEYFSGDCVDETGIFEIDIYATPCFKLKKRGFRIVYEEDLKEMEEIKEQCSSPASESFDDRESGAPVKRRRKF